MTESPETNRCFSQPMSSSTGYPVLHPGSQSSGKDRLPPLSWNLLALEVGIHL